MKAPGDPPHCHCGCGERVRSSKNGIWSHWLPGHNARHSDWQNRTPEPRQARRRRQQGVQLSLFPDEDPE